MPSSKVKQAAIHEAWRNKAKNRAKRTAWQLRWSRKNRDKVAANRRRSKFGTDGKALWDQQQGRCAICQEDLNTKSLRNQHLDHNKQTGVVRGWLCKHCNVGIGHFREEAGRLQAAILYLRLHEVLG